MSQPEFEFAALRYTNGEITLEVAAVKILAIGLVALVLLASVPASAIESRAYRLREDMGTEPLYDGVLQYYYYVPCATYSWFWAFGGDIDNPWENGTRVGAWFEIGDLSTGGWDACDPTQCHTLDRVRVLDLLGVGGYPGHFRCTMDIYCCDEFGCPVGPSLWKSDPYWTGYGWNYFDVEPLICLSGCSADPGPPASTPRILVTITHDGMGHLGVPYDNLNAWGADAISIPIEEGCMMHDEGCLPALYPRPHNSHYGTIHSGYYGRDFEYCPPQWFRDPRDSTPGGTDYGFLELAWRIYVACTGPTETRPATWGSIKSLYK